jgi:hypothetical protein
VFNEVLDEHLVNCTCIFLIGQLAEKDNLIRQCCYLKAVKPVAAPGLRIGGGAFEGQTHIWGGKIEFLKFGTHDPGPIAILQKKLKPGGGRSSSPFFDLAETHLNCKKSMFPWANFDETHIIRTSVGHSINPS